MSTRAILGWLGLNAPEGACRGRLDHVVMDLVDVLVEFVLARETSLVAWAVEHGAEQLRRFGAVNAPNMTAEISPPRKGFVGRGTGFVRAAVLALPAKVRVEVS